MNVSCGTALFYCLSLNCLSLRMKCSHRTTRRNFEFGLAGCNNTHVYCRIRITRKSTTNIERLNIRLSARDLFIWLSLRYKRHVNHTMRFKDCERRLARRSLSKRLAPSCLDCVRDSVDAQVRVY